MEGQMLDTQKKMLRMARLSYVTNIILVIALIVAAAILIPKTREMNDRVQTMFDNVEESVKKIDMVSADAQTLIGNAGTMIGNLNKMITDNTEAVTETISKLNGVDFDLLSEAINNLNTAIKPLAEFAKLFQ